MKKTVFLLFSSLLILSSLVQSQPAYELFYKPQNAWSADYIPFYDKGEFRLFYLLDWRNKEKFGEGTPWYQISTKDFIHFTEHGEMLARGTKDEQDLYVFTGSVIKAGNTYHIFYTGHNSYFRKLGKPEQGVMHAVSSDLLHWKKIPEDTFYAPTDRYEPNDWRDPFVFRNEETGEYWMLLAARVKKNIPSNRRGCTALCTSKDLKKWEVQEPFWEPGLYYTHECPDFFKMGDWWYFLYSTFSERFVTHYRMSKSLKGPWIAPENDAFDGRAYYAAKSYSDGAKRYLFGWNATRSEEKDYTSWNWGGNLVVHEIIQNPDGTLSVKVPETVDNLFKKELPAVFSPRQGQWKITGNQASVNAVDSYASALSGEMPSCCKIASTVTFGKNTKGCGIILRASDDLEQNYYVRLEPVRNRLVFDSTPRKDADIPFMVEIERPVNLTPDVPHEIKVFVDNTVCEVYVDNKVAMSTRMYNFKKGKWGIFVSEGTASFSDSKILGK